MKLTYEDVCVFIADLQKDDVEAVRSWIDRGLELDKKLSDDYPYTPLSLAAHMGAIGVMEHLLEQGAKVDKGARNWTPLMEAVEDGQKEAVRMLLDAGADPNLRSGADDEGDSKLTALMLAAEMRNMDIVRMLLDAGADPKAVSNKGRSALNFAINGDEKGRMEMVRTLIDAGTPAVGACLVWPAEDADIELTRILIAAGADPNQPSDKFDQTPAGPGVYPIHLAIMARWMKDMFKAVSDALGRDVQQEKDRLLEVIRELIKAGADINAQSKGLWVIRESSIKGDREVLAILKEAGWQEPQKRSVAVESKVPEDKRPGQEYSGGSTAAGQMSGALDFLRFVFKGHPEWSVLIVEAPIEEVAGALAGFRKARSWTKDVPVKQLGENDAPPVDETPAVQLEGSPWTVLIRSIFDISAVEIAGVPEEAQALSKELKTRAVTFMGEDTSGAMGYEIYENGSLIERADWDGGGNLFGFKSKTRKQPDWSKDDFAIADMVFKELGIYIPVCIAEVDGDESWIAADRKVRKQIKRADLINI